jgi:hypothetical protein
VSRSRRLPPAVCAAALAGPIASRPLAACFGLAQGDPDRLQACACHSSHGSVACGCGCAGSCSASS